MERRAEAARDAGNPVCRAPKSTRRHFGESRKTPEMVRQAMAELRDPQRRLLHELWAQLPAERVAITPNGSDGGSGPGPWPDAVSALGFEPKVTLAVLGLLLLFFCARFTFCRVMNKDDQRSEEGQQDLKLSLKLCGWLLFAGSLVYALESLRHGEVYWLILPLLLLSLLWRPMFIVLDVLVPRGLARWDVSDGDAALWASADRRGQALLYANLALCARRATAMSATTKRFCWKTKAVPGGGGAVGGSVARLAARGSSRLCRFCAVWTRSIRRSSQTGRWRSRMKFCWSMRCESATGKKCRRCRLNRLRHRCRSSLRLALIFSSLFRRKIRPRLVIGCIGCGCGRQRNSICCGCSNRRKSTIHKARQCGTDGPL